MGANLVISILLFAVSGFAGGEACFAIFAPDGSIAVDLRKPTDSPDKPKSTRLHEEKMDLTAEDAILDVLGMFGGLRNHRMGYADKGGKEILMLSRRLAGGFTIEMTYESDTHDGVKVFNYKLLELVSPGGYRDVLSKKPVDDINWTFAQEYYYFDGPVGQFSLRIPLRIEGPMIEEMKTWGERLEYLEPTDLQKLTKTSSMSELRGLYFKYFKKSQKALHITGTIKGYSKLLFNAATYALIAYFTLKQASGDDEDTDHSALFMLLMNFKGGTRISGIENTQALIDDFESKGSVILSKEFMDPEPMAGKTRMITVSEYPTAITVVEMTYERGRVVDGNAIVIPHEEGIFKLLARALRAK